MDSNHRLAGSKPAALPLGDAPTSSGANYSREGRDIQPACGKAAPFGRRRADGGPRQLFVATGGEHRAAGAGHVGRRLEYLDLLGLRIDPAEAAVVRDRRRPDAEPENAVAVARQPVGRRRQAADPGRALARQGDDTAAWVAAMLRHLKPGGRLTLIQRVEQLGPLLQALAPKAGGIELIPLHSKPGQAAKRLILRAVKGGKAPLALRPGLVLHQPDGRYYPEIDAVLRDGAALPI